MLTIDNKQFTSRLMLGTARYPSLKVLDDALVASGTEIVTVSIRRVNPANQGPGSFYESLKRYTLLPNTAGCYTAKEAIYTAQLAREALGTHWIKLETIGDERTLYPAPKELLAATKALIADGFFVLPYSPNDIDTCRALVDLGCEVVMPLCAPIGSGQGIVDPAHMQKLRDALPDTTLVIDAGIGRPSDVTMAFELGYDAVLMNTAVAGAMSPVRMAEAMKHAAIAGRLAYKSGIIPRKQYATSSSPLEGMIEPHG